MNYTKPLKVSNRQVDEEDDIDDEYDIATSVDAKYRSIKNTFVWLANNSVSSLKQSTHRDELIR